jgi:hypothetical protein
MADAASGNLPNNRNALTTSDDAVGSHSMHSIAGTAHTCYVEATYTASRASMRLKISSTGGNRTALASPPYPVQQAAVMHTVLPAWHAVCCRACIHVTLQLRHHPCSNARIALSWRSPFSHRAVAVPISPPTAPTNQIDHPLVCCPLCNCSAGWAAGNS